jgi:hypothetical protein
VVDTVTIRVGFDEIECTVRSTYVGMLGGGALDAATSNRATPVAIEPAGDRAPFTMWRRTADHGGLAWMKPDGGSDLIEMWCDNGGRVEWLAARLVLSG